MGTTVTLKSAPAKFTMEKIKNKQSQTKTSDDKAKTKPNKQENPVQRADQASKTNKLTGKRRQNSKLISP